MMMMMMTTIAVCCCSTVNLALQHQLAPLLQRERNNSELQVAKQAFIMALNECEAYVTDIRGPTAS
jgi:hypothetical protein